MTTSNDERLERDLEAAFAATVPDLQFETSAQRPAARRVVGGRVRIAAGAGLAAAVALGAVLLAPAFLGDGTKTASAEELIHRSIAASEAAEQSVENYHMVTVGRVPGSEVVTETWFGGANRYRSESRSTVHGTILIEGTASIDGEMWVFGGPEEDVSVAHGPAVYQVLPPQPASVDEQLSAWTADGCFDASLAGRETVAGREAHVVTVVPTDDCPRPRKPLGEATIWIDVQTYLQLKSVYKSQSGDEASSFEVTRMETFTSLPDSAFVYLPPVGAQVVEFTTLTELKAAFDSAVIIVPRGSHVIIEHDWRVPAPPNP